MAGVVKGMDATLKSMNLEKVGSNLNMKKYLLPYFPFSYLLETNLHKLKQVSQSPFPDLRPHGQI